MNTDSGSDTVKLNKLKQKSKDEFIERNELLIMNLAEKIAKTDTKKFIKMNGLELLMLLYEKHKTKVNYLNSIGNCLCLISLDPKNHRLFIQSGWLKRLNQMSFKEKNIDETDDKNGELNLLRELLSHKILFNLNQSVHDDNNPLLYSTMLYPLNQIDSDVIKLSSNMIDYNSELMKSVINHKHVVDVIFVHGLRGGLFKTWRQQDKPNVNEKTPDDNTNSEIDFSKLEKNILGKLNNLIEEIQGKRSYSYCWPKDWLANDLNEQSPDVCFRLIGVNYESLFSSWEQEELNEKEKHGIKEKAIKLIKELKDAHVGQRPIIWVCHSMGGLKVKQMLVHISENENKLDYKKMSKSDEKKFIASSIVKNTKSIIFLSTPHLGSSIAKTMTNFSFATFPSNEIIELATNSTYLIDLNKKFLSLIR